jgi:hypothetical protein
MEPKSFMLALRPVIWLLLVALPVVILPGRSGHSLLSVNGSTTVAGNCLTCGSPPS